MEINADPGGEVLPRRGLVGEREESEVEPQLRGKRTRRDIVRAAERG